ncbi:MAG: polymer-forming cytoskeletal protein [Alphaproteobacteria bacterium]|nr:polymer-forming cytoskeletal protein [Alphaproteobacteria bacterium]
MASEPPQKQGGAAEPSYISRDARFVGDLFADGEIHIDGLVQGSVHAHTCLVENNGEVQGSISAQFVLVRGRVLGPIAATQVTIQKGAHVEGNVLHEGLSIEQGAFVMGSVTQSGVQASSAAPAPASQFSERLFDAPRPFEDDESLAPEPQVLQLKAQK